MYILINIINKHVIYLIPYNIHNLMGNSNLFLNLLHLILNNNHHKNYFFHQLKNNLQKIILILYQNMFFYNYYSYEIILYHLFLVYINEYFYLVILIKNHLKKLLNQFQYQKNIYFNII